MEAVQTDIGMICRQPAKHGSCFGKLSGRGQRLRQFKTVVGDFGEALSQLPKDVDCLACEPRGPQVIAQVFLVHRHLGTIRDQLSQTRKGLIGLARRAEPRGHFLLVLGYLVKLLGHLLE